MAAQDYYNSGTQGLSAYPSSNDARALSPLSNVSSFSPSSTTYLGANDRSQQSASPAPVKHSPFDSVFDDHLYPANSHQSSFSSRNQPSQDTVHPSRPSSSGMAHNHSAGDIPLQDQNKHSRNPLDVQFNDHVYDSPQGQDQGRRDRKKKHKGQVRFGELGMLESGGMTIPFVVYLFTTIQLAVFIGELVKTSQLTGSPIVKPALNPMLGPGSYVLINMGSRFVPCMHELKELDSLSDNGWPCPNSTSTTASGCTLSQLCGFGGVGAPPNQWWRFITPIFMHAGIIHILFNLLMQLTMGKEIEKSIGSIRFFLVYVSSGIFGNVLGANFAGTAVSSTGASGALFGIIALTLLDLLYSWKDRRSPIKDLAFIMLDIVISFVLGLLPGLDNFAHIGGFLMGLSLGISVLHSPNTLRRRIGENVPYIQVSDGFIKEVSPPSFHKNPVAFFKGRKLLWWAWWLVRVGAAVVVFIVFIVLLNNFYVNRSTCSWCKYLSCINVNNWCEDNIKVVNRTEPSNRARSLLAAIEQAGLDFSA